MPDGWSTQKLLDLRKLTRAVADGLRNDLAEHLATLLPLVRPRTLLGSYVQGAPKDARGSDKAFKDLQNAYESVASAKPFNLSRDLKPPIAVDSSALEILPFEYEHTAKSRKTTKTIRITSPLKWVVAFAGYAPERLKGAFATGDPSVSAASTLLHALVLHVALQQRGIHNLFAALRYPLATHHDPALGPLPITVVSSPVATVRPPDETLIESTEVAGADVFEEVVDEAAINKLQDPLGARLAALVQEHRDRQTR
jgi:hypothetical protein